MNNLYYGFRGDPGQRAPPQPSSQSLLPTGKDQGPQNVLTSSFPLSNPLNGSMRHANSSNSAIPFPNQPWANDIPVTTAQSQLLQHHPQLNFSQQQQPPSTASFQATQSMRPTAVGLSGGRVPVSTRQPGYDEGVYHIINKGFPDSSGVGNAGIPAQPESLLSSHMPQQSAQQDMYARHTPIGTNTVFDPSEFPTLGGGTNPAQSTANSASNLLPSTSGFESMTANFTAPIPSSINGMGAYSDLYGLGAYSNTRSKAVDALTGSGRAGEFSMQSEDFPALGGGTNGGNSAGAVNIAGTSQPSGLESGLQGLNRLPGMERVPASSTDAYFNVSAQPHLRDQFESGSTSYVVPNTLGSSALGSMQVPDSSALPSNLSKGKATASNFAGLDRTSQQLGQQALEELARIAPNPHAERQSVPTSVGQGLFDTAGIPSQNNAYLNASSQYGTRAQRPVTGSFATASSANFDGNTSTNRDPYAKISGGTLNHSDLQDASKRAQMRGPLPSSTTNGLVQSDDSSSALLSHLRKVQNDDTGGVKADTELAPSEKYGMKGLLGMLNPSQGENGSSDVALLSVGLDLTMLGLNLNSNEPLHLSFESPWSAGQTNKSDSENQNATGQRSEEPDYKLPACYYMSPPALKTSHFTKFQLETLFYIFYNLPRDVLQQLAAIELHNREWRYHKDLKLWFTRAPGTDSGYERGAYIYFDITSWERRPFHDANISFEEGLMTEEELRAVHIPSHMSTA